MASAPSARTRDFIAAFLSVIRRFEADRPPRLLFMVLGFSFVSRAGVLSRRRSLVLRMLASSGRDLERCGAVAQHGRGTRSQVQSRHRHCPQRERQTGHSLSVAGGSSNGRLEDRRRALHDAVGLEAGEDVTRGDANEVARPAYRPPAPCGLCIFSSPACGDGGCARLWSVRAYRGFSGRKIFLEGHHALTILMRSRTSGAP